jgi:surface antigen
MKISIQPQRLASLSKTNGHKSAKATVSRRSKKTIKISTLALYSSLFVVLVTVIALGYKTPQGDAVASLSSSIPQNAVTPQPSSPTVSVNQVVATNIAATMAASTDLPVANNVANLSASLAAKSDFSSSDDTTAVSKQQVIQPTTTNNQIVTYTAVAGDTTDSVSSKYGISKNTLMWANNLTSDVIDANKQLIILPVNGILYTVKDGDTVDSIATKYKADPARITALNNLELAGVAKDQKIIIPDGDLPETERPGYVAPRPTYTTRSQSNSNNLSSSFGGSYTAGSVGNRYAYGYCTWYAYERRASMGRSVGSFWGNANTWAAAARSQGYGVDNEPSAGAVFQTSYGGGGYGHVGIVERVDYDAGVVYYSDMNGIAGWGRVGNSSMSISEMKSRYMFIH